MTMAPTQTPTNPSGGDRHGGNTTSRRKRRGSAGAAVIARGEPMVWLTGGALVLALVMIVGLLTLVLINGLSSFWPLDIKQVTTVDGDVLMGPITREQAYTPDEPESFLADFSPEAQARLRTTLNENEGELTRRLVRTANYDVTAERFRWVIDSLIVEETQPEWAIAIERLEWGRFNGFPKAYVELNLLEVVQDSATASYEDRLAEVQDKIGENPDGRVLVGRAVDGRTAPVLVPVSEVQPGDQIEAFTTTDQIVEGREASWQAFREVHGEARATWHEQRHIEKHELGHVNSMMEAARKRLRAVEIRQGADSEAYAQAQQRYDQRLEELNAQDAQLTEEINELKAINARKIMIFTTAQGADNLIQVSDIVRAFPANQLSVVEKFGVYLGRWWEFLADEPREANTEGGVFPVIFGTVFMVLIMTILVVPFGVLAALYIREYAKAGPVISVIRIAINNLAGVPSIVYGVFGLGFFCYIVGAGVDDLFFPVSAADGNPVFGKTALIWASFTLALLTLPVVIVATEEALSAVPNSMREGSYACGASKWQTIKRIVLPRALPGMMTGMILAMARGAGEVAPLMVVGAVKLAPELPFSIYPSEQFGVNRSFMHLGFHIYDLGFQSPDSEAARPMVYTTTLLLITIVVVMNVTAIYLRNRLRKKFVSGAF